MFMTRILSQKNGSLCNVLIFSPRFQLLSLDAWKYILEGNWNQNDNFHSPSSCHFHLLVIGIFDGLPDICVGNWNLL